jgi:hypothetical protein
MAAVALGNVTSSQAPPTPLRQPERKQDQPVGPEPRTDCGSCTGTLRAPTKRVLFNGGRASCTRNVRERVMRGCSTRWQAHRSVTRVWLSLEPQD